MSTSHLQAERIGICAPRQPAQAGSRAQASVEFLAYAGFFLLVMVVAVSVFDQLQSGEQSRAENAYALSIADEFAAHINAAVAAGPGYSEIVAIPSDIEGQPYNVSLSYSYFPAASQETGFVYVEWRDQNSVLNSVSAPTISTLYNVSSPSGCVYLDNTDNPGRITLTSPCTVQLSTVYEGQVPYIYIEQAAQP